MLALVNTETFTGEESPGDLPLFTGFEYTALNRAH